MWWRLPKSEWKRQQGDGNRRGLKKMVNKGIPTGILAYAGNQPVGWCAIAPRRDFSRLERSHILRPVDDRPVWSVVCFVIVKAFRRRGLTVELLRAAVEYAGKHGARIVEGYPVEPKKVSLPDVYAYTGIASAFIKAGFKEVARRSPTRPIMRYTLSELR